MPAMDTRHRALLFDEARTHNGWLDRPVEERLLHELYDLLRMPPTSANCQPARLVFVKGAAAKERLKPALYQGNVDKTMAAPVTAIVAYDIKFLDNLPRLMPHAPQFAAQLQKMPSDQAEQMAFQSSTLQGAYLIIAARGLGLDCGPMGGFDRAKVDAAFFPDGLWKSNFLVNLGYGDASKLYPRAPRLSFEEACRIA
jgi:3-hydroxypropanoate dehydrogenase